MQRTTPAPFFTAHGLPTSAPLRPSAALQQGLDLFFPSDQQNRDVVLPSRLERAFHNRRGREIAASVIQEAGGDFNLTELLRELEEEMQQASANLEFERAALLRDQIMEVKSGTGLTKIEPKRKPVKYTRRRSRV